MDDHLLPIHPKIMWEYGPAVRVDGHRLVLTPESAHELRPLVARILERAPSIPGWDGDPNRHELAVLSIVPSVLLLVVYLGATWYSLRRHRSIHISDEPE